MEEIKFIGMGERIYKRKRKQTYLFCEKSNREKKGKKIQNRRKVESGKCGKVRKFKV